MNKYHNTYESLGILYKDEISQDQLISIEFDLNSNIARLDKRLGSIKGAKDSIQEKLTIIKEKMVVILVLLRHIIITKKY